MRYSRILFLLTLMMFFGFATVVAQTVTVVELTPLPETLTESSGLVHHENHTFWSNNDSGNPAELYRIDTLGQVLQVLEVMSTNTDWEELTKDEGGNLYVGDFGNNANERMDLQVLRIAASALGLAGPAVVDTIAFSYGDQNEFPPSADQKHYDLEAMVWWNDTLHLFSKDRTSPYLGMTRHFRLPATIGNHVIFPTDTFYTGQTNNILSVTGAALSGDGEKLVLINANSIWLFSDYDGTEFFSGTVSHLQLGSFTQKEAVCFVDDMLYFTDERSPLSDGSLYRVNPQLFVGIKEVIPNIEFNAIYDTYGTFIGLRWEPTGVVRQWEAFATDGRSLSKGDLNTNARGIDASEISGLHSGNVVFHLIDAHGRRSALLVRILR